MGKQDVLTVSFLVPCRNTIIWYTWDKVENGVFGELSLPTDEWRGVFYFHDSVDWKQSLLPSMSVEVGGEETLSDETKLLLRIKPACV